MDHVDDGYPDSAFLSDAALVDRNLKAVPSVRYCPDFGKLVQRIEQVKATAARFGIYIALIALVLNIPSWVGFQDLPNVVSFLVVISIACTVVGIVASDLVVFLQKLDVAVTCSLGSFPGNPSAELTAGKVLGCVLRSLLPTPLQYAMGSAPIAIPRYFFVGSIFSFFHLACVMHHALEAPGAAGVDVALRFSTAYYCFFFTKAANLHDVNMYSGRGLHLTCLVLAISFYFIACVGTGYSVWEDRHTATTTTQLACPNPAARGHGQPVSELLLLTCPAAVRTSFATPSIRVYIGLTGWEQVLFCFGEIYYIRVLYYRKLQAAKRSAKIVFDMIGWFPVATADFVSISHMASALLLVAILGLEPFVIAMLAFTLFDTPGDDIRSTCDLSHDMRGLAGYLDEAELKYYTASPGFAAEVAAMRNGTPPPQHAADGGDGWAGALRAGVTEEPDFGELAERSLVSLLAAVSSPSFPPLGRQPRRMPPTVERRGVATDSTTALTLRASLCFFDLPNPSLRYGIVFRWWFATRVFRACAVLPLSYTALLLIHASQWWPWGAPRAPRAPPPSLNKVERIVTAVFSHGIAKIQHDWFLFDDVLDELYVQTSYWGTAAVTGRKSLDLIAHAHRYDDLLRKLRSRSRSRGTRGARAEEGAGAEPAAAAAPPPQPPPEEAEADEKVSLIHLHRYAAWRNLHKMMLHARDAAPPDPHAPSAGEAGGAHHHHQPQQPQQPQQPDQPGGQPAAAAAAAAAPPPPRVAAFVRCPLMRAILLRDCDAANPGGVVSRPAACAISAFPEPSAAEVMRCVAKEVRWWAGVAHALTSGIDYVAHRGLGGTPAPHIRWGWRRFLLAGTGVFYLIKVLSTAGGGNGGNGGGSGAMPVPAPPGSGGGAPDADLPQPAAPPPAALGKQVLLDKVPALIDPVFSTPVALLQVFCKKGWHAVAQQDAFLRRSGAAPPPPSSTPAPPPGDPIASAAPPGPEVVQAAAVFLSVARDEALLRRLGEINTTREGRGERNHVAASSAAASGLMTDDERASALICGARCVHLLQQLLRNWCRGLLRLSHPHPPQLGPPQAVAVPPLPRCWVLSNFSQSVYVMLSRYRGGRLSFALHPTVFLVSTVLSAEAAGQASGEGPPRALDFLTEELGAQKRHLAPWNDILQSSPFFCVVWLLLTYLDAVLQDASLSFAPRVALSALSSLVDLGAVGLLHTLSPDWVKAAVLKLAALTFSLVARSPPRTGGALAEVRQCLWLINTLSHRHSEALIALKSSPQVLSRLFGALMDYDDATVQADAHGLMARLDEVVVEATPPGEAGGDGGAVASADVPPPPAEPYTSVVGVDDTCCICLLDFEPEEEVTRLKPCKHHFHMKCVRVWLYTHSICPKCRTELA